MTVTVSSFGFARGMPPAADLVFDMRFLDNPHWEPELRDLTGLDEPVGAHISKDEGFAPTSDASATCCSTCFRATPRRARAYVNIAFGCTGGRHRSVFTAETIAAALRAAAFRPTVLHRNLGSRAAELIEGSHQP